MSLNSLAVNLGSAVGSSIGGLPLVSGGLSAVGVATLAYEVAGITSAWSRPP